MNFMAKTIKLTEAEEYIKELQGMVELKDIKQDLKFP